MSRWNNWGSVVPACPTSCRWVNNVGLISKAIWLPEPYVFYFQLSFSCSSQEMEKRTSVHWLISPLKSSLLHEKMWWGWFLIINRAFHIRSTWEKYDDLIIIIKCVPKLANWRIFQWFWDLHVIYKEEFWNHVTQTCFQCDLCTVISWVSIYPNSYGSLMRSVQKLRANWEIFTEIWHLWHKIMWFCISQGWD